MSGAAVWEHLEKFLRTWYATYIDNDRKKIIEIMRLRIAFILEFLTITSNMLHWDRLFCIK